MVFNGFPPGKMSFTPVPGPFFRELLPLIDDLNELKVTLYAFWRLDQMEGGFRYLRRDDFAGDEEFMAGLGEDSNSELDAALSRAVERGAFLQVAVELEGEEARFYFLNTERGQAAVQAIQDGRWQPSEDPERPVVLSRERPNIFRLYEDNIGPLTPMIAETLREAEDDYEAEWIEDAIRIAVKNNVHRWNYVQAILKKWKEHGRDDQKDRRGSEEDPQRYLEDYQDLFEN